MTRVSVLADLVYTMAVREKQRFKPAAKGWSKRKDELLSSLSAMQFLCQLMARPVQEDALCPVIIATVPHLCPLLKKEPEFWQGFSARFRPAYMGAAQTAGLSADESALIALANNVLSHATLLLGGRRAESEETIAALNRWLQGLHNVIRPLLPEDDRFRVTPAEGWSYAREWLEPDFTVTLSEPEAEEEKAE